jgi:hypothetical protein
MAITSNPINQNGALITAQGTKTFFNITANTLIKAGVGRVAKISVIVAGSGAGSVHDSATIGAAGTANELAVIGATAGVLNIDMPVFNGIVVKPGTGQTLAVSFI